MARALTLFAILLISAGAESLPAQAVVLGGGLTAGTIPRVLEPLCNSARRLHGVGLAGRAGVAASRFQVSATVDYVARVGVRDAAECIARSGMSVDSLFSPAENSAWSLGITGWLPLIGVFGMGLEVGGVLGHPSWFVGSVLGAQVRNVRVEVAARSHFVSFDEITREYSSGTVRELSRRTDSERSWGAVARVLLLTR